MAQGFFQHFWEGPLRPFWGEIFGILTEIGKISSSIFMPPMTMAGALSITPVRPYVCTYVRMYVVSTYVCPTTSAL